MNIEGRRVGVTGASGFLGRWLVDELLRSGARVRALVRNPARTRRWASEPRVEVVVADLRDPAALTRGMQGVDALIGNAALATPTNLSWEANDVANRVGTGNVVRAMREAGVTRYVHVSTMGVYRIPAPWRVRRPITLPEDHPLWTPQDRRAAGPYCTSKRLAERVATEGCAAAGIALTIARPATIYGPGDPNVGPLLRRLQGLPVLPMPEVFFPMVYVRDLAAAIVACLRVDATIGRALNLTRDGEPFADFVEAWYRVLGRGPRVLRLPPRVALSFANTTAQQLGCFRNRPLEEAIRETLALEQGGP